MVIGIFYLGIASIIIGLFFQTKLGEKVYDFLLGLMDIDINDYPNE